MIILYTNRAKNKTSQKVRVVTNSILTRKPKGSRLPNNTVEVRCCMVHKNRDRVFFEPNC